jgi:hypothetical protein
MLHTCLVPKAYLGNRNIIAKAPALTPYYRSRASDYIRSQAGAWERDIAYFLRDKSRITLVKKFINQNDGNKNYKRTYRKTWFIR